MIGMCPYHTTKNGMYVADGLLMGCSHTGVIQPSLEQFYNALEKELYEGLNLKYEKSPDVSYLAHQGVLMLNAALTTELNKAGSHIELWKPFTEYLLEEVLSVTMVPTIFLGKDAARYIKHTNPFSKVFVLSHPASASYKNTEWDSEGVFKQVNKLLKENNGWEIEWLYEPAPF
jgi:uracil-DNA glycosylase